VTRISLDVKSYLTLQHDGVQRDRCLWWFWQRNHGHHRVFSQQQIL